MDRLAFVLALSLLVPSDHRTDDGSGPPGPAQPESPLGQASPSEPQGGADKEFAEYGRLARIFQALHATEVKGKRWVRAQVGYTNWKREVLGWLLDADASTFKLLAEDGTALVLKKPRPGEQQPSLKEDQDLSLDQLFSWGDLVAWHVQDEDFRAHCRRFLDDGLPDLAPIRGEFRFMDGGRSELSLFAVRACRRAVWLQQAGEKALAVQLVALGQRAHSKYDERFCHVNDRQPLHEFLATRIAARLRADGASGAHGREKRERLLEPWEQLAKLPYHEYAGEAKDMVRHYQSLIREDRAWVEPDKESLKKMTASQQAAYWMYHLRDHRAEPCGSPGRCSVLFTWPALGEDKADKPNPALELQTLGLAAVPLLIAHLDDGRPTRCLGWWRSYAPESYYVLRYGDCCQQIFESITGHRVYEGSDYPMRDGKGTECKAKAQRWWQDYQRKGEQQMLVEGTAAGKPDSPEQARRLAARYPEAALPPLRKGARQAQEERTRTDLIRAAYDLKGHDAQSFLREELAGPWLAGRVAAAKGLVLRGQGEGAQALVREWKQIRWDQYNAFRDGWTFQELIAGMARCGEASAVQELAAGIRRRPVEVRAWIIRSFADPQVDLRGRPFSQAVREAVEGLMVEALADTDQERSVRGGPGGRTLADPAVGDLAAEVLVGLWKEPQRFDIHGSLQARERQRAEVKNVWLLRQRKRPLPVPAPRRIEPAPEAVVRPLQDGVRKAKTPAERQNAARALEQLGLPALPAVRQLLASTEPDQPAHGLLQTLARRLAWRVEEIRFAADSVKPGAALQERVDTFRGSPATEEKLLELLGALTGTLPAGLRGFRLTLERLDDGTGACLLICLIADNSGNRGVPSQLSVHEKVVVGERQLLHASRAAAGIDRPGRVSDVDWGEFVKHLQTALAAPPDSYVLVQVEYQEER